MQEGNISKKPKVKTVPHYHQMYSIQIFSQVSLGIQQFNLGPSLEERHSKARKSTKERGQICHQSIHV